MKKLVLALLALVSVTAANAQKGTWLTYGNVGVNQNTIRDDSMNTKTRQMGWNVNPGIGYQFNKCMTIGVQGGYASERSEVENRYGTHYTQHTGQRNDWEVGLFLRHTYSISNIFFIYSQLNASYLAGKVFNPDVQTGMTSGGDPIFSHTEDTYTGFGVSWTPAVGIMIHEGMALNFSIGGISYTSMGWDYANTTKLTTENNFNFTWGHQFNIGISRNMGCCHKKHHGMEPGMEMRKMKKHDKDEDDE